MRRILYPGFGLKQVITSPTKISSSSSTYIDRNICSDDCYIIGYRVFDFSEHSLVYWIVNEVFCGIASCNLRFWGFSSFSLASLRLAWFPFFGTTFITIDVKIEFLTCNFSRLSNVFAPIKTAEPFRPKFPRITLNIKLMMRLRDRARARFGRINHVNVWKYFKTLRHLVTVSIRWEKRAYFE